jgi:transcriptional regulator with GAF, ATPase, and Fis domain
MCVPLLSQGEIVGALYVGNDEVKHLFERRQLDLLTIFASQASLILQNAMLLSALRADKEKLQGELVDKRFGEIIGACASMTEVFRKLTKVAATDISVLVTGETGTGKELIAREIHRRSTRVNGPFVTVNCGAIPENLMESEMFGHVRGAFTGAIATRAGKFQQASAGTLFLDEVGELTPQLQVKLLRAIQEKVVYRVGDSRPEQCDIRILAATNRSLEEMIKTGEFREDLYYRLNVFPIQVPPLRQRMDDIPLLAKHFVELSAKELKCAKPRLTRAAVTHLQSYDWPGNVRELRNVVERAVILARGGALEFDLPISGQLAPVAPPGPQAASTLGSPAQPKFLTEVEVQRFERDNLVAALEAANWKISGPDSAAELLGLKPTTLLSRMTKWGLKRPERVSS